MHRIGKRAFLHPASRPCYRRGPGLPAHVRPAMGGPADAADDRSPGSTGGEPAHPAVTFARTMPGVVDRLWRAQWLSSGSLGCHLEATGIRPRAAASDGVCRRTPGLTTGIRARRQTGSGWTFGPRQARSRSQPPRPAGPRPACGHQRDGRRPRRVRPRAADEVCQRSICGRSQSIGRPRPRLTTGRGMSG
jgi:hypothetical protein